MNILHTALIISLSAVAAAQEAGPDPASFDRDGNGLLDESELRQYIVRRDKLKPDMGRLLNTDLTFKAKVETREEIEALFRKDVEDKASDALGELKAHLHPLQPPYPLQVFKQPIADGSDGPSSPADQPLEKPGVLRVPRTSTHGSFGPILLRRSADDWSSPVGSAAGALFSYANDRRRDRSSWTAEGALIYPLHFRRDTEPRRTGSPLHSQSLRLMPSVGWKFVDLRGGNDDEINELTFKTPFVWSANLANRGALRNVDVSLSPYILTDHQLDGGVAGVSLDLLAYVQTASSGFALNTGYKGLAPGSRVFYQLGFVPTLDFHRRLSDSPYLPRTADDEHLRLGGKALAAIRTRHYPSLELKASYQWFSRLAGGPEHSDLLALTAKAWFTENVAASFEHQDGETPIARREIDLSTLGLELRF